MSGISPVISAAIKIQASVRGQQLRNKQLFEAAESGDISEVKNLLAREADVNAKGRYGRTALHLAVYDGNLDIVKALVIAGANVNVTNKHGMIVLELAKNNDCYDDVKKAIEEGKNELIKLSLIHI